MTKKYLYIILLTGLILSAALKVSAQNPGTSVTTRILFIFDASNSMSGSLDGKTSKIQTARNMLTHLVDSLDQFENIEMALRIYGHQSPVPPQDCSDTRLEVPFGKRNGKRIIQEIENIEPKGTTPIARSLEEAGEDFPNCNNCRNIIILITDGIEACDGDPCAIALSLYNKGIALKPFVIGIGLDVEFKEAFECMGDFYNTTKEDDFRKITHEIIRKTVSGTTVQISLLDKNNQPRETDVGITVYDSESNEIVKNFVHTLNILGNPDTLALSPEMSYDITVHTIPEVKLKKAEVTAGIHNDIRISSPQGSLNVIQNDGLEHQGLKYIVRKHGESQTLHVGEMFEPENYIVGKYDLEILTLPPIKKTGVEIRQSQSNLIRIERPGLANIFFPAKGYAGLYLISNNQVQLIKRLNMKNRANLRLQPGRYMVIYRPQKAYSVISSVERQFIIRPGQSVNVNLR
jgi:Ca-activated chloride channel family protein